MKLFTVMIGLLFLLSFQEADIQNFRLKNTNNEFVSYKDLKGEKLTVINFWAIWCKPCVNSIPKLNQIAEETKSQGVNFIGVNVDGPRNLSKIKPFTNALGVTYPILLDTDMEVVEKLNVGVFPTLFIVDQNDKIVFMHEGFKVGDDNVIKNKIQELLTGN